MSSNNLEKMSDRSEGDVADSDVTESNLLVEENPQASTSSSASHTAELRDSANPMCGRPASKVGPSLVKSGHLPSPSSQDDSKGDATKRNFPLSLSDQKGKEDSIGNIAHCSECERTSSTVKPATQSSHSAGNQRSIEEAEHDPQPSQCTGDGKKKDASGQSVTSYSEQGKDIINHVPTSTQQKADDKHRQCNPNFPASFPTQRREGVEVDDIAEHGAASTHGADKDISSRAAGNDMHSDTDSGQPDFCQLPELLWISVFQSLSLADRYRLSQVNWFLNTLFYDAAVWRKADITFERILVHGYFFMSSHKLRLPALSKKLARKFGHLYRDVTLCLRGRPQALEDDTLQILALLQRSWRLESLTLDIGDREWGNRYQGVETMGFALLEEVAAILRDSPSLRHLHVLHWPQSHFIDQLSLQLCQVLSAAECPKLRSLRLPRTTENGLQTLTSPRELALDAFDKFRCLTHLHLTSDMLSDKLLAAMVKVKARDARLLKLTVEIHGFWSTGFLEHLLSPLSWTTVTSRNPDFEVVLTISADIPEFVLERFLVPEIPLVAVTFDINCHCYRKAFQLMHQYSDSLRSFGCLSHAQDCELDLLDMVRACPALQHLRYHGDVSDYNVFKLAQCRSGGEEEGVGRRWGEFSFVWPRIEKMRQRPTPFNLVGHPHREVARKGEEEEGGSGGRRTEEEVMAEFSLQVSQRLGFPWQPLVL